MSIHLNHSGSCIWIFSPQKPGRKESWWVQASPRSYWDGQGALLNPEAGKTLAGTAEYLLFLPLIFMTDAKMVFCSLFGLHFLLYFQRVWQSSSEKGCLLLFPGCGSLGQVDRGWERRLQCLHADWKAPEKAHGLLVAKEQIYSQASEVKERIHS